MVTAESGRIGKKVLKTAGKVVGGELLKATGTYGFYQVYKEAREPYPSDDIFNGLLLSAGLGVLELPLASRGLSRGMLKGSMIASFAGGTIGWFVDVATLCSLTQVVPQIEHVFPGSEHMLGGMAPIMIAFAGRNLLLHHFADGLGVVANVFSQKKNR